MKTEPKIGKIYYRIGTINKIHFTSLQKITVTRITGEIKSKNDTPFFCLVCKNLKKGNFFLADGHKFLDQFDKTYKIQYLPEEVILKLKVKYKIYDEIIK